MKTCDAFCSGLVLLSASFPNFLIPQSISTELAIYRYPQENTTDVAPILYGRLRPFSNAIAWDNRAIVFRIE